MHVMPKMLVDRGMFFVYCTTIPNAYRLLFISGYAGRLLFVFVLFISYNKQFLTQIVFSSSQVTQVVFSSSPAAIQTWTYQPEDVPLQTWTWQHEEVPRISKFE